MSTLSGNRGRPVSLRRRFFSLPTLLSFAVAAGVLYFLATGFDLSWGRTWESIRGMDPRLYLVAVFLYYVSFAFRGLRWRMLARNAGVLDTPGATLPSAALFSQMILIGWFVNAAVGFRLGDAYRANTLSGASNAGFSWSLWHGAGGESDRHGDGPCHGYCWRGRLFCLQGLRRRGLCRGRCIHHGLHAGRSARVDEGVRRTARAVPSGPA